MSITSTAISVEDYRRVRSLTLRLCEPLQTEDFIVQSMSDASPVRWHLAHTTWFFDTFILAGDVPSASRQYRYLFNSYYNAVGEQFPRAARGQLSRPTVAEVIGYRQEIDTAVEELLSRGIDDQLQTLMAIGLNHEQQHQELILTDLKHAFSINPLHPRYHDENVRLSEAPAAETDAMGYMEFEGGMTEIGGCERDRFCFDNELGRHAVYLRPYRLADRLVSNADYIEFIADGGYSRSELWLSEGWAWRQQQGLGGPIYWRDGEGRSVRESADLDHLQEFTLCGLQPLTKSRPLCHISYFEADAYARWAGARLPSEAEWEHAAVHWPEETVASASGAFCDVLMDRGEAIHPLSAHDSRSSGLLGNAWQWTSSSYGPYPGFRIAPGAVGEYNGKFMCNQYVLRGGSVATSSDHIRATYRNFFPTHARWQFTGIRLARD